MAEIGTRTFVLGGTTPFLRLYKEEFVRSLGNDMTTGRIRLGLLASISDTGGNLAATTFFFGLCSSVYSPYGDANCIHAMGWRQSGTMARTGGANPYYSGSAFNAIKRINGVDNTQSFASFTPTFATNAGALQRRSALIIDITLWNQVNAWASTSGQVVTDIGPSDFLEVMENNAAIYNTNTLTASSNQTIAGTSNVTLDTMNIYWDNGLAPLEIYALAVYRYNF